MRVHLCMCVYVCVCICLCVCTCACMCPAYALCVHTALHDVRAPLDHPTRALPRAHSPPTPHCRANELARWCPSLRVASLMGPKDDRAEFVAERLRPWQSAAERGWHVLLTTYECAVLERSALGRVPWQYVIIDEAHRIKNEASALAGVVRSLLSAHRLLITGTPLQNNLHELWALLNFLSECGSGERFGSAFLVRVALQWRGASAGGVR